MPEADWKHIVEKYLNNTCTREELHQLLQWVNEEPDNEALVAMLRIRWEQQQALAADDGTRGKQGIGGDDAVSREQAGINEDDPARRNQQGIAGDDPTRRNQQGIAADNPTRRNQHLVFAADDPARWEQRFEQLLAAAPPSRLKAISRRAMMAAAAVLLLLLTTTVTYYFYHTRSSIVATPATVQANDVPPGGNRAMLTLADGTQISLDSAANGVLATQGGARISKQQNGQIAYDGSSANAQQQFNVMSIPKAGKYSLVLSDGSKIWLNSASTLRYPLAFGKERRVQLTGEAYFEIAQDAKHPFIVEVNNMELQVLGTSFNVMAYAEEGQMKTTLVDGALAVNHRGARALLKPGQQATVAANDPEITIAAADLEEALAWKNDRFYFNNTDIRTAMRQLERWYDVDFTFRDTLNMRLNGTVSRTVSISGVLKLLTLTGEANFTIQGRTVTVGK